MEKRPGDGKFFFTKSLRLHDKLFKHIQSRYSGLFKGERTGVRKNREVFGRRLVENYLDDINYLNMVVCEGRITDIKELEKMSVEEYYSTLDIFVKLKKQEK